MTEKKQLWLVKTYKRNILTQEEFLTDEIDITDLVHNFCWKYTEYDPEHDYILIRPSSISFYARDMSDDD